MAGVAGDVHGYGIGTQFLLDFRHGQAFPVLPDDDGGDALAGGGQGVRVALHVGKMVTMGIDEAGCEAEAVAVDDLFVFECFQIPDCDDFLILHADGGGVGRFATAIDQEDVPDEGGGSSADGKRP